MTIPRDNTEDNEFESLFVQHLAFIDKALTSAARVLGLRGDDADEFASWARERLCVDRYSLLRKWRGESKLTTYLGAVIINLGREFRVRRWGRWRPSAAARRLGVLALRLERLVYRDGWSLAEASELLRARCETSASDRALADIFAQIPQRESARRRDKEDVPLEALPDERDSSELLDETERDEQQRIVRLALLSALEELDATNRLILRMHFFDGRSFADIAHALSIDNKRVYRLKDDALGVLKARLEAAGITWEQVRDLLGGLPEKLPTDEGFRAAAAPSRVTGTEMPKERPSKESYDSVRSGETSVSSDAKRSARSDE